MFRSNPIHSYPNVVHAPIKPGTFLSKRGTDFGKRGAKYTKQGESPIKPGTKPWIIRFMSKWPFDRLLKSAHELMDGFRMVLNLGGLVGEKQRDRSALVFFTWAHFDLA